MTLTEFLLARIAEDEAAARAAIQPDQLYPWGDRRLPRRKPEDFPEDVLGYLGGTWGEHCARWSPLRVLAESEAKRRLVERADHVSAMDQQIESEWGTRGSVPEDEDEGVLILRILALPYAEHPDYQQEWRA